MNVSIPSSSGHQFTVRHDILFLIQKGHIVSIPSSSGHQFTECESGVSRSGPGKGFNPFFIRASVYWER